MPATELKSRYFEGIGRRKTSHARVRVSEATRADFMVNGKKMEEYFLTAELREIARASFSLAEISKIPTVTVHVAGGGIHSQAEAIKMGIARALSLMTPELRKPLKVLGLLARDARAKERRKFGLKKARKAPQWSKR